MYAKHKRNFLSNNTVKLLLALNRGNEEFKSDRYDNKFAAMLVKDIIPSSDINNEIRRAFVFGKENS